MGIALITEILNEDTCAAAVIQDFVMLLNALFDEVAGSFAIGHAAPKIELMLSEGIAFIVIRKIHVLFGMKRTAAFTAPDCKVLMLKGAHDGGNLGLLFRLVIRAGIRTERQ
jgi:hypothetical protein